jgi:hypothetical protein
MSGRGTDSTCVAVRCIRCVSYCMLHPLRLVLYVACGRGQPRETGTATATGGAVLLTPSAKLSTLSSATWLTSMKTVGVAAAESVPRYLMTPDAVFAAHTRSRPGPAGRGRVRRDGCEAHARTRALRGCSAHLHEGSAGGGPGGSGGTQGCEVHTQEYSVGAGQGRGLADGTHRRERATSSGPPARP